MISKNVLLKLLNLGDGLEVRSIAYEAKVGCLAISVGETKKVWSKQVCPRPGCQRRTIVFKEYESSRSWRHLDLFGKRTDILCAVPTGRCARCDHAYRLPVPWEGEGKRYTKEFEAFALKLMCEMPVEKARELIGESDPDQWRMIFRRG